MLNVEVILGIGAAAILFRLVIFRWTEAERVAACVRDGICPDCGRATLVDAQIVKGCMGWFLRYGPGIECTSCNVKRPLPKAVRDERIRAARESKQVDKQRSNFRRVK
jgi:hypothetical protein